MSKRRVIANRNSQKVRRGVVVVGEDQTEQ